MTTELPNAILQLLVRDPRRVEMNNYPVNVNPPVIHQLVKSATEINCLYRVIRMSISPPSM